MRTGFMHLVHAVDADQMEVITRGWYWKPRRPTWGQPDQDLYQHHSQARAINQVVNALKSSVQDSPYLELHVVNGISSAPSSLTTATKENVILNPHDFDGLSRRPCASRGWMSGGE